MRADDGEHFLADYHQVRSSHSRVSVMTKSGSLDSPKRPGVHKRYPHATTIEITRPDSRHDDGTLTVVATGE